MTDADAPQRDEGADLLARYRSEIRFESELLSNRLNSFMSSQSFLLIAYASAMSAAHSTSWQHPFTLALPPALAVLGLVLALYARPGIRTAYAEIRLWQEQERELLAREPRLSTYLGPSIPAGSATASGSQAGAEMDVRFRHGSSFALRAPAIFVLAWTYFAILPFVFYSS